MFIVIYRFPELGATCDRTLTKMSPLCFRAKDHFVSLLSSCFLSALSCFHSAFSCFLSAFSCFLMLSLCFFMFSLNFFSLSISRSPHFASTTLHDEHSFVSCWKREVDYDFIDHSSCYILLLFFQSFLFPQALIRCMIYLAPNLTPRQTLWVMPTANPLARLGRPFRNLQR